MGTELLAKGAAPSAPRAGPCPASSHSSLPAAPHVPPSCPARHGRKHTAECWPVTVPGGLWQAGLPAQLCPRVLGACRPARRSRAPPSAGRVILSTAAVCRQGRPCQAVLCVVGRLADPRLYRKRHRTPQPTTKPVSGSCKHPLGGQSRPQLRAGSTLAVPDPHPSADSSLVSGPVSICFWDPPGEVEGD